MRPVVLPVLAAVSLLSVCGSSHRSNHREQNSIEDIVSSPLVPQLLNHRALAVGDFARFNELFAGAELILVDSIDVGDVIKLTISKLFCRDINLGDVQTSYTISASTGIDILAYTVNVNPFTMTCEGDYRYELDLGITSIEGSGRFVTVAENNSVLTRIDLSGPSTFAQSPPTTAVVGSCEAVVNTNGNIEFDGTTFQQLLDLDVVKDIISNVVDNQASDVLCNQLNELGPAMMNNLLNRTDVRLDAWLAPISSELANPLLAETTYVTPDNVTLIHFQRNSTEESVSDVFVRFLKEADALFGEAVTDPSTGATELGINVLLRQSLLNETTGDWVVNLEELEDFDPVLFASDGKLTQSSIRIDAIKVVGLDTLQSFEPFVDIGAHTISNTLNWAKLELDIDLSVDIKPSTRPDAILQNPDPSVNLIEKIQIRIDLTNLNVTLALFMAIDQARFEGLDLGSLLSSKNLLPCFLSSMLALEVSGLDVTIEDVSVPTLDGFVSPGIDRVLSQLAEAAFVAYEPTLLRAIPGVFQGPVRNLLKTRLLTTVLQYGDDAACPPLPVLSDDNGGPPVLDFRDLFLKPDEAKASGASGEQPYGNVGHIAYRLLQDRFVREGEDGLPMINDILIRRATITQSGVPGLIRIPRTLFEFGGNVSDAESSMRALQSQNTTILDTIGGGFRFSLSDIRLSNLDTMVNPMQLLNLTTSPSVVRNSVRMGQGTGRNITFSIRVIAGFGDTLNEIDINATIESLDVLADIGALMNANSLLEFSLGDILNYNCWLTALLPVSLDDEGYPVDATTRRSLSLESFTTSISSLALASDCISCVSPGARLLSELLQILEEVRAVQTLEERIPSLLESLSASDTTQTFLDRLVVDAPKFCPSNAEYTADAVKTTYKTIGFPALSAVSIDTLLFSSVLAAELAFVMFVETQRSNGAAPSNALSTQDAFVSPAGMRLIDWTAISNSTGMPSIVDDIFLQARKFLSGTDGGAFDFKEILDGLLAEDGTLEIDTDIKFERENIALSLASVKVKGLDTFSLFDVLEPIGAQTLSSSVQFDVLEFDMVLLASVPTLPNPPQTITARFAFQNVSADIALFAAFDLDKLGGLRLGSLLETKSLVKCILSAAHVFEIPQMKVSLGSFSNPTVAGLLPDADTATSKSIDIIFDRFREEILEAVPIIFDGVGKDLIARLLSSGGDRSCDEAMEASSSSGFIDFRDLLFSKEEAIRYGGSGKGQYGDLGSRAFTFIKDNLLAADKETGLAAINRKVIAKIGEAQSGTPGRLFFSGDLINGERRVQAGGLDANVQIRVSDAYINNLDTFGVPLTILDPVSGEGQTFNNSAMVGVRRSLQLGVRFFLGLSGEGSDIENDIDMSLDFDTLKLLVTGLAMISEQSFLGFPIRDIANLQCWLAAIALPPIDSRGVRLNQTSTSLSITKFVASVAELGLNISCISCTGPRIPELSALLSDLEGSDAVTDFANAAFDFVTRLVEGEFLQLTVDRALNDARKRCPHSQEYIPDFNRTAYDAFESPEREGSITFLLAMFIVTAGLLAAILTVSVLTKLVVRRRHLRWLAALSSRNLQIARANQNKRDDKETYLNDATDSMFKSSVIPACSRWGMPVVILLNIGFFLSGHLSLGASVTILASLGGETFTENGFFEFSIASSVQKIWEAGGEELAILIFVTSFLWPYAKQLITLGLWFAPPTSVSIERRGSILLWLDALAKWSMIDIFVLIVTIVSFRVSVQSPDVDFLPPDFYSIDLLVVPKWGLYANVLAQIICQVSSHVIIHYHRRIVDAAESCTVPDITKTSTALIDDDDNEIEQPRSSPGKSFRDHAPVSAIETESRLCMHAFKRPHRGESDKLIARRLVNPILIMLACIACVLVVIGCILPSYSLNALGLVGILVESGQQFSAAEKEYSVFTTINVLFEQAGLTGGILDFIGLGGMSFLLILSVLVVPVVQSLALLVQWFAPLTKKRRHRLSVFLEILHAWQYTEVYMLAILVGSWQLGPISEFMINPYCESLSSLFAELVYYGIFKEEDAQCFRTDVAVEPTFIVLIVSAIALALLNSFVMGSTSQFLRDSDAMTDLIVSGQGTSDLEDLDDLAEFEDTASDETGSSGIIHPPPVLFTDQYRWLLHREDRLQRSSGDGDGELNCEHTGSLGHGHSSDEDVGAQRGRDSHAEVPPVGQSTMREETPFNDDSLTLQSVNMEERTDGDIVTVVESVPFALEDTIALNDNGFTTFESDDIDNDDRTYTFDSTIASDDIGFAAAQNGDFDAVWDRQFAFDETVPNNNDRF